MIRIGITQGDPQGIGGEIILKSLQDQRFSSNAEFTIYGDSTLLSSSLPVLGKFLPLTSGPTGSCWTPKECGQASILYLEHAVQDAIDGKIDALVTAPISKANVQQAGFAHPGHTEFLAEKTGTKKFVMMMASPTLKVSLVTIHVPLQKVPSLLTPEKIINTVKITYDSLKTYWGLPQPRVAVCGLNPHAGEEGLLGNEEIEVIAPALEKLRAEGYPAEGPLVPDAVFHQAYAGKFDAVVCMYHDQGLIPFKMLHFQDGVNVTLGLPIIRTSPDHGVAYDIAGKGIADPASMVAAIGLAMQMAKQRIRRS